MASTRTVYRGSKGRFAGSGGGKAERVKSGGFANAAFRARVAQSRVASGTGARGSKKGKGKASFIQRHQKGIQRGVRVGSYVAAGALVAGALRAPTGGGNAGSKVNGRNVPGGGKGNPPSFVKATRRLTPNSPRTEAIPTVGRVPGVSLRDAVRAQAASSVKAGPNYNLAKGTKEYVGRRVTDGNYGFVMKAAKKR